MKKALLLLAAAAACAIALPATAARNKTLKGSGRIVTETRDVGSFHAVEAGSIAHVLVGDYPAGRVTVKTDDNLLVHVQTSVAEGTLRIGLADVTVQNAELTVYVPAAGITRLDAKGIAAFSLETPLAGITGLKAGGAAKITAEHPLQTNDAAIEASGTAHIAVEAMTGSLERISATGGSVIELKGQPAGADAAIETSGTAHIAVEAMMGSLERISATGGSEIELKSTATGRAIELRASGTSRLVCNGELLCDDASIESSGAARITTRVKCTECRIESSGTSATQVSLDATSLHAESSGGAGMTLAGTTRACRIVAGGTSRIDATGLKSEQWDTTVGKFSALKR